jgi:sulfide:quinone oxidoreductase
MKILVVGGGMGGTILANNLARRLSGEIKAGKASITMLSASDKHMYQPGLLYVAVGKMMPDELYRDQVSLLESSITFRVDPVTKFNLKENNVVTESGKQYDYDMIVISTGSRAHAEGTPGLAENASQFYTEADAVKMFSALQNFEGGKVMVAVGVPHNAPWHRLKLLLCWQITSRNEGFGIKSSCTIRTPSVVSIV